MPQPYTEFRTGNPKGSEARVTTQPIKGAKPLPSPPSSIRQSFAGFQLPVRVVVADSNTGYTS